MPGCRPAIVGACYGSDNPAITSTSILVVIRAASVVTRTLVLVAMIGSSATSIAAQRRAPGGARSTNASSHVTLTYLGTAGWEISDGATVILVDPYLSRIPLLADRTALPA